MLQINRAAALAFVAATLISAPVMLAQTAEPTAPVDIPATAEASVTAEATASAQATGTAEASSDVKTVVLNALHGLLSESFHYTIDNTFTLTITGESNVPQTSVTLTHADGDVGANGSSHMTIAVQAGETVEQAKTGPHGSFERIIADGVTYINADDSLKAILPIDVESGWYKLDDLASKLESTAMQAGLKSIAESALPARLVVPDDTVTRVTAVEPETGDAEGVRVFDVTFDGAALAVQQTPGSPVDKLKELFQNRQLYAASKFDSTARVTIDADGRIIKMHTEGHTYLPYLSVGSKAGLSGLPSFDIDQVNSADITVTNYGQSVEIVAPNTVE